MRPKAVGDSARGKACRLMLDSEIVPEAGAMIKNTSRRHIESQLQVEEKVLAGAENILKAYSNTPTATEMKHQAESVIIGSLMCTHVEQDDGSRCS